MNESTHQPPRRFDREFKRAAVDRWLASGKTAQEMAAELGIHDWNLRDWRKNLNPSPDPAPVSVRPQSTAELEAEVRRLRQENQSLRNQRDILKKSLGILCEPLTNASRI